MTHIVYTDPATRLVVGLHAQETNGSHALDSVAELENRGTKDTPIIEEILAMDVLLTLSVGEPLRLHHAKGSACGMDDFLPQTTDLPPAPKRCSCRTAAGHPMARSLS